PALLAPDTAPRYAASRLLGVTDFALLGRDGFGRNTNLSARVGPAGPYRGPALLAPDTAPRYAASRLLGVTDFALLGVTDFALLGVTDFALLGVMEKISGGAR
ncbi:MAG: hypothetical protein ACP5O6_13005, partial [Candidatus Baltobacteraceae bacterium]